MAMKRTKEPWMRAADFGRSLPRGIGLNLLVTEVAPAEAFLCVVLGANTIHADEDFAAIELARLRADAARRPFLPRPRDVRRH